MFMNVKNKNWFTLVELIVVITILAILATIAFISFQWYSASSRDSVRISDMRNIEKSLNLKQSIWSQLPLPDDFMTISSSGVIINYQWVVWKKMLADLNIHWWAVDPVLWRYYDYSVNFNRNKYQLLWYLESDNYTFWLQARTYAIDFTYYTRGSKIWFLMDQNTNLSIYNQWADIDLVSTSDTYRYYIDEKNDITWSWEDFEPLAAWWDLLWYWDFEEMVDSWFIDKSWNNTLSTSTWGISLVSWMDWNSLLINWTWSTMVTFENIDGLGEYSWSPHTISMWINPNTVTCSWNSSCRQWLLLLWSQSSWSHHWLIWLNDWYNQFWIRSWPQKNPTIIANQWQHIVVTYDGNIVRSFRNWVEEFTNSAEKKKTEMNIKNANLYLSNNWPSESNYNWYIDNLRVYWRALSDNEIQALYNIENN